MKRQLTDRFVRSFRGGLPTMRLFYGIRRAVLRELGQDQQPAQPGQAFILLAPAG